MHSTTKKQEKAPTSASSSTQVTVGLDAQKTKYLKGLISDFFLEDYITIDDLVNYSYDGALNKILNVYEDVYMSIPCVTNKLQENSGSISGQVYFTA